MNAFNLKKNKNPMTLLPCTTKKQKEKQ